MVTGKSPYYNVPPLSLPLEVCFRKYREKIPEHTDPQTKELINKLWDENPDNRLTMQELLDILYYMRDPVSHYYYCRVYDHVPDDLFNNILKILVTDRLAILSLATTCKRFYSLVRSFTNNNN